MGMILKNNMGAIRTLNTLNMNDKNLQKSLSKVSTGMKINSAEDDASAYGISERMRVRMRALEQANQNTQNDSSLMKTAEGAVANTIEILKSLKEKAINAANDSNTDEDRATLQKEIDQLIDQVDDNALVTFNGKYMLTGLSSNAIKANSNSNTWSRTILLNQSLATDTSPGQRVTTLKNRVGDSLGIQSSDLWQVSWVINGQVTIESGKVSQLANLAWLLLGNQISPRNPQIDYSSVAAGGQIGYDRYGEKLFATEAGVSVCSKIDGLEGAIAGYTINIMDSAGNPRKAANAALNAFSAIKVAENNKGEVGFGKMFNFQVGSEANQAIKINFRDMRAHALGIKSSTGETISVATKDYANAAISVFDNALETALDQQTSIGAILARLEYTSSNIILSNENVQAAESVIRDSDMAKEMTEYTKNNVLLQAAQAMLAQANQNSSAVLSLLQ